MPLSVELGRVASFTPWLEAALGRISLLVLQVLGESMAGISQNAKTGDLPAFGECVGIASKALCGLTEAAAQVRNWSLCRSSNLEPCVGSWVPEVTRPLWEAWGALALLFL